MRRFSRMKLAASCLAIIAVAGISGCKKADATNEFSSDSVSSPVSISESVSVSAPVQQTTSEGTGSSKIIDNVGKLQYKINEEEYKKVLESGVPTKDGTMTGHAVYKQEDGALFIISGDKKIMLEEGKIPSSAWDDLREEETGNKILVQVGKDEAVETTLVSNFNIGREAAIKAITQAKEGNAEDRVFVINNSVVEMTGENKPQYEDGVVYVPASVLINSAANFEVIQEDSGRITFTVVDNKGDKHAFVIDSNNPEMISVPNEAESLTSEMPLVVKSGDEVYVDPVALANVFDWKVEPYGKILEGKYGCLNIITDQTLANGYAIQSLNCRVPQSVTVVTPEKEAELDKVYAEKISQFEKEKAEQEAADKASSRAQAKAELESELIRQGGGKVSQETVSQAIAQKEQEWAEEDKAEEQRKTEEQAAEEKAQQQSSQQGTVSQQASQKQEKLSDYKPGELTYEQFKAKGFGDDGAYMEWYFGTKMQSTPEGVDYSFDQGLSGTVHNYG